MPPRRRRVPKYRHYKPKNLAVVRIEGRDHYLGKCDPPPKLGTLPPLGCGVAWKRQRRISIDTSEDVWLYKPWTHKTEHLGHARIVAIGPKAQGILRPFLRADDLTSYVFSPNKAVRELQEERRKRRRSPMTPSQRRRRPKKKPERSPGDQYTKRTMLRPSREHVPRPVCSGRPLVSLLTLTTRSVFSIHSLRPLLL